MAYPLRKITYPAAVAAAPNGLLPPDLLSSTPGRAGGKTVTLAVPAARSWRAMESAAAADGIDLLVSAETNSYRPYPTQESIWRQRYKRIFNPLRPRSYRWNGQTWWHWFKATAARPGTSNHGKGVGVDLVLRPGVFDWMLANGERFGWGMELVEEEWHWIFFVGDAIPAAVLAYERGLSIPALPRGNEEETDMVIANNFNDWRLLIPDTGTVIATGSPGAGRIPDATVDRASWDKLVAYFEKANRLIRA
jgi:hypothetical protein